MKSKDITKYDPEWQIVRVKIKGPKIPYDTKIKSVLGYFNKHKTRDAGERVANFIEGLAMGYKGKSTQDFVNMVLANITKLGDYQSLPKENLKNDQQVLEELKTFSKEDRILLWKDLFKRGQNWAQKSGYSHKGQDHFMGLLAKSLKNDLPSNYSFDEYFKLNKVAKVKKQDNPKSTFFF